MEIPQSTTSLERHSDLWFDDGSVVCRAENTLFRVHMSQLARHSECFRDMFSLAQPSNKEEEVIDGCPVLVLQDTAEDVASLFFALYDGPTFGRNDEDDFRVTSGILRLATKYIIDNLRVKAIAHLQTAWPLTLRAWDAREDLARDNLSYPSPIDVISLAREVEAPSLLPSAFYDLSRYSYAQIFSENFDMTRCMSPSLLPEHPPPVFPPTSCTISTSDMQRLCLGKEITQQSITNLIQTMPSVRASTAPRRLSATGNRMLIPVCISAAACRRDFDELVDLATQHYMFDRERGWCDPLYVAEELGQLKSGEGLGGDLEGCKACAQALEAWASRERERIWRMLPVWFRLEPGTIISD